MPASPFLLGHLDRVREASQHGPVADLACGRGRNALALAERGVPAIGVDRNAGFLAELRAADSAGRVALVRADLENEAGALPLRAGSCGAVLVFRYLHRPLAPAIEAALAPGGWLLYETFTTAQRAHGWGPTRDAFLLQPGELPTLFPGLEVGEYREGDVPSPGDDERPEAVAQLLARRRA